MLESELKEMQSENQKPEKFDVQTNQIFYHSTSRNYKNQLNF